MKTKFRKLLLLCCMLTALLTAGASAAELTFPQIQSQQNWKNANNLYTVSAGWSNNYELGFNTNFHLYDNGDGTLSMVFVSEATTTLYIENYNAEGNLVATKTVPMELPIFGAFLAGDNAFYVAYGKDNPAESVTMIVWCVTKYDRNWNKIASYTVAAGETYTQSAFQGGISRMALSEDESMLALYAGHWMGGHQEAIPFLIDTETMTAETEMSFTRSHVSHSFGRFVLFDGDKLVTMDHGDSTPRCFYLQTDYDFVSASLLSFYGSRGDTITNAMGCGFQKSSEGYLFLACTAPQDGNVTPWNVFLRFVEKTPPNPMPTLEELQTRYPDLIITIGSTSGRFTFSQEVGDVTYYIASPNDKFTDEMIEDVSTIFSELETAYEQIPNFTIMPAVWVTDSQEDIGCARLVKMSDNSFVVMWGLNGNLHWRMLNARGEYVGEEHVMEGVPMPPNEPVVVGNTIRWIQAPSGTPYLYTLDVTTGALVTLRNGLYQNESGVWCYYVNNVVQYNYTGLAEYAGTHFYVENGILNWDHTGLVYHDGVYYYVENGVVNFEYTDLVIYDGAFFYVENGVLNWKYTGLVCYAGTFFYVENGMLNWNYTGLVYYAGTFFYVENGMLNWSYTGLSYYAGLYFYVENGMLNWDYTGLAILDNNFFYIENGTLNWNYTGLAYYEGIYFYIENGMLNWSYYGLCNYAGVWFYIEGGMLTWNYNGTVTGPDGNVYEVVGSIVQM